VVAYKTRNEVSQAIIYNIFIRAASLSVFLQAVQFVSENYDPNGTKTKFVMLLEQMCRVAMNGQTTAQILANPPANKSYLVPIIMVDLLNGRSADFNYEKFTQSAGQNFPREIFDLYTPEIKTAIHGIAIQAGDQDALYTIRDQVLHILNP
jgi:hypothetical protein